MENFYSEFEHRSSSLVQGIEQRSRDMSVSAGGYGMTGRRTGLGHEAGRGNCAD